MRETLHTRKRSLKELAVSPEVNTLAINAQRRRSCRPTASVDNTCQNSAIHLARRVRLQQQHECSAQKHAIHSMTLLNLRHVKSAMLPGFV